MRKPTKAEIEYQVLNRMASEDITEESIVKLRYILNASPSLFASKAAEIAGKRGISYLVPEMISAFNRFLINGAKTDKQCNAKTAIVNALNDLEYPGDEVYLQGAKYVQMEPAFGGVVDTAVQIRCNCAHALARIDHINAYYILSDLLVDPETAVRAAAVRALTYMGKPESELLLRFRVLTGDRELDVISECFSGLMIMSADRSLLFVARYLDPKNIQLAECAALAIGGSHCSQAFDTLVECWNDNLFPAMRKILLLPIALLRSDAAFSFLLSLIRSSDEKLACEAVSALNLYSDDESIRRIRKIVVARNNDNVMERFLKEFV